jgi:hypothetical protein
MTRSSNNDIREPERAGRSRRRLLAGAAGALGLLAGETIGRATPAQAGMDGDVVLGATNTTGSTTTIDTSGGGSTTLSLFAAGGNAIQAQNGGSFPAVSAINTAVNGGSAGLFGGSVSGEGLYAQSGHGNGTNPGKTRNGVHGVTDSATDSAVWGEAISGGFGVAGSTESHGVDGAAGVWGNNSATGPGVLGVSHGGPGVIGVTSGGTGVLAENISGDGGHALRVIGAASFSRSGHVTIAAPHASATVITPGALAASALVLALLQTSAPGVFVTAAVPSHSKGTVTIHLNKAPARQHPVKVAWFVVN